MTKPNRKPPPPDPRPKLTMWGAIGFAVQAGWGPTLRLALVLLILGSFILAAIVASGGPERVTIGAAAKIIAEWARLLA